jgi:4-methyl-5(b-hydroxyethyl)-thiazole monophosphate biosynthesis
MLLAAICAAPSILGHGGYLCGKHATCYPGFESELQDAILGNGVVVDGNIITASGAGVAVDFALALVRNLVSAEVADAIRGGIQCP